MTEKEILELLLEKVTNLEKGQEKLEAGQKNLEAGMEKLEARQGNLELGQEKIISDIEELKHLSKVIIDQTANLTESRTESKEAFDRLNVKVDKISEDIALIEVVSAKNMGDIAKLKLIK